MVQVPTTTPSTGYRNNILHISYCAAGVSRQGRRPEVIPAVSSFFPLFLPLLFHLLLFFSHFFFHLPFSSLTLSSPPPLSLRLLSVTPLPYPLSILGCPSLLLFLLLFLLSLFHPPLFFVFSQLHPSHTPPLDTLRFFPPD